MKNAKGMDVKKKEGDKKSKKKMDDDGNIFRIILCRGIRVRNL